MNTTDDQNSYQSTFIAYVISGVQEALERVRAAEPLPDEHDRQFAWHILSYAFNFDEAWPCTRELLLALAPKMEQAGFREDWMLYLEQGVRQSQALNDQSIAAECQLQIGMLYRLQSKFDLARQQLTASVAGFATLHATRDQARALNELAWLNHLQHRYVEATQQVEAALGLLNDEDPERAMNYRILGMIAIGQMHWSEAEKYHLRALALFHQQDDIRKIAWSRQNVGYALKEQGKFEEALEHYQQALSVLEQLKDIYNLAAVQVNIGNVLVCLRRSSEALEFYFVAQKTFESINDLLNLGRLQTCLGLAYLDLTWYIHAQQAFTTAANLYETLKDEIWKLNAWDGLAIAYIATKQYSQAIHVLEKALGSISVLKDNPYYDKLFNELMEHLQQAKAGQELLI